MQVSRPRCFFSRLLFSTLNDDRHVIPANSSKVRRRAKEFSALQVKKELERRIRDKHLDRIVAMERQESQYGSFSEPDPESQPDHQVDESSSCDMCSLVARRMFKRSIEHYRAGQYGDVVVRLADRQKLMKSSEKGSKLSTPNVPKMANETFYPYANVTNVGQDIVDEGKKKDGSYSASVSFDRGFFMFGNESKDDYIAGSCMDLPHQSQYSLNTQSRLPMQNQHSNQADVVVKQRRPETILKRLGPDDAVEEIQFQLPHQCDRQVAHLDRGSSSGDWRMNYDAETDPDLPSTTANDHRCSGCGAQFHCKNASLPGFLPVDYFLACYKRRFEPIQGEWILCRRCYLLKEHKFLLNVNVTPVDYQSTLGQLRRLTDVLVVLVVDMCDFPCSIYQRLPDLIGQGKHTIVVGNKVDLLPPDANLEYLKHYVKCLKRSLVDLKFYQKLNILGVELISAKTGFGIESLISMIYSKFGYKGDVYLVGCTNTGKSTLFNALLQSDLCKIRAVDLVERATTSVWPGTTLNLLKFPVMNPTPLRLIQRNQRLKHVERLVEKEEQHKRLLFDSTGQETYAILQGYVGQTFGTPEDIPLSELQALEIEEKQGRTRKPEDQMENGARKLHFIKNPYSDKKNKISLNSDEFQRGNWCFDTPGTVSDDQIINLLTLDELIDTIPSGLITPRLIKLYKGRSMLIGGLVRIDFVDSTKSSPVILNVFCNDRLPIHVLDGWEVPRFYSKYISTAVLKVPRGDDARLASFPQLVSRTVELQGEGYNQYSADVVFSSVGWAAVKFSANGQCMLNVWTPSGLGVHRRQPPLISQPQLQRQQDDDGNRHQSHHNGDANDHHGTAHHSRRAVV